MYNVKLALIACCVLVYVANYWLRKEINKIVANDAYYKDVYRNGVKDYKKLYDLIRKNQSIRNLIICFGYMRLISI